jgi:O-antigen ligase
MDFPMKTAHPDWIFRLSLFLLGAMMAAPFLDPRHFAPIPSFYGEWLAAVLGLGACLALLPGQVMRKPEVPRIIIVPFGLIAIALIQLVVQDSPYPGQTIVFVLYLTWAAMLALLGHTLVGAVGLQRLTAALSWGLLIGGLLSASTGFLQLAKTGPLHGFVLPWNSVIGNVGQANNFADHLWLAIAAAAYLFAGKRLNRGLFLLAAAMLVWASLLSGSRSVFFFLAAILILAALWRRREATETTRRLLMGALAVVALVAGVQVLMGGSGLLFEHTAMTGFERLVALPASPGGSVRLEDWRAALDAFSSSPLLGIGVGRFSWHMFLIADRLDLPMGVPVAEHAHNIVLQLLAELGPFAPILVVAGLLAWLARMLKREASIELWLVLALLAVMLIHSQLEYPLWYSFFLGPCALLLGAGDDRAYRLESPRLLRLASAGTMALGAVFLVGAAVDYPRMRGGILAQAQSAGPETRTLNPDLARLRQNILLTPHVDLQLAIAMPLMGEPRAEKIRLCDDALRFNSARRAVFKCALLLALDGQSAAADTLWRQAVAAFPAELPHLIDELKDMPEAQGGGALAPLREHAEGRLKELRARGLLEPEAPPSSPRSP